MPSYKNLVITALAASSVSPALSAPIQSSQRESRAEVAHPQMLFPYSNPDLMVSDSVPPAGGSSKRAADAPESRAIAQAEERGAPVVQTPTVVQRPTVFVVKPAQRPKPSAGKMAAVAGGGVLLGALGAYTIHEHDKAHPDPPPGYSSQIIHQLPQKAFESNPDGSNSKRDNVIFVAPLPNEGLSGVHQRDVPSPEVNVLNQRADYTPEDVALRVLGRALNELD